MSGLNEKEKMFCQFYSICRNGREAAVKAGFSSRPEKKARKLLSRNEILAEIEKTERTDSSVGSEVRAGLRRLAFASSADAVKLMFTDDVCIEDIEKLDLFNISEIKRPKGGGLEIKFFDRIKALERLYEAGEDSSDQKSIPFFEALEKSAENLYGNGECE